jgi:hypothetical protein
MIPIYNKAERETGYDYPFGISSLILDTKEDMSKFIQMIDSHSKESRHVTAKIDLSEIVSLRNYARAEPSFSYGIKGLEPGLEIFFSDRNANFAISTKFVDEVLIDKKLMLRMRDTKRKLGENLFTVGYVHGRQLSDDGETIAEWYSAISLNDEFPASLNFEVKEISFLKPDFDDMHELFKNIGSDTEGNKRFWEMSRTEDMKLWANAMTYATEIGLDAWIVCQQVLKYPPLENTLSNVPVNGEIDIKTTLRKLVSFATIKNFSLPQREQLKWVVDADCLREFPYWRNGHWQNWERVEEDWNNPSGNVYF